MRIYEMKIVDNFCTQLLGVQIKLAVVLKTRRKCKDSFGIVRNRVIKYVLS